MEGDGSRDADGFVGILERGSVVGILGWERVRQVSLRARLDMGLV